MSATPFTDLTALATHLRQELQTKKFILLYAYNGTGKTRLSTEFKNIGKKVNADGETIERDTLYFNAFTEDLFAWDNDLDNDRERMLELNKDSSFFDGLSSLEMDVKIGKHLERYADFSFYIDYEKWVVTFFRERDEDNNPIPIKVSRGEENIFIWCFFLAIVQLALDGEQTYQWVKYIYIDDPISSLDEHNAITVANHLAQILKRPGSTLKSVISTHHTLFFNVLFNEIKEDTRNKKAFPFFLSRDNAPGSYLVRETGETPFFHHVAALAELYEADRSGRLYTHHFNMLRSILEKTASFHGYRHFSACIKKDAKDEDGILHQRLINILSHGGYSLYEPQEMLEENKQYFRKILHDFISRYPFNPALFPQPTTPVVATATTPVPVSATELAPASVTSKS